jgi:hypothetical protein
MKGQSLSRLSSSDTHKKSSLIPKETPKVSISLNHKGTGLGGEEIGLNK